MRKICVAASLPVVLMCSAQAQSNVTLYGVADVFAEYGKAGTQAAPTTNSKLRSGGLNGSRLGFKGTEDLGNGLSANFVLEHGILLDSGTQASAAGFWNRQAYVGLSSTGWGALTAGRQYTPLLVHQDTFDPAICTTGYGSAYNTGVMRTISRANNSVLYASPNFGGLTGTLMAALGENALGAHYGFISSGSLKYAGGPAAVGVAYLHQNKTTATQVGKSIVNVSGSMKFGAFQLIAGLQHTDNDIQNANVKDNRNEYLLGGVYSFGQSQVRVSYGQATVKDADSSTVRHGSIGYLYNLSKRTALYGAVQAIKNPDNLAYRTAGYTYDAIDDGPPAGAGVNARAIGIGMRHRF